MLQNTKKSRAALDSLIKKSRVHLYKPIQIAEILFYSRTKESIDLKDLESYRNVSKKWRDIVSVRLVGRKSTSSQKYQDNIFEANAMPPEALYVLEITNRNSKGLVEAYIYKSLEKRLDSVREVEKYIKNTAPDNFSLKYLISLFIENPGLRRSVDKMYEITVYALFSSIIRVLGLQISLEIQNKDTKILADFEDFIKTVIGSNAQKSKIVLPAALFRVGVTNAADRGLDMWSNFGPAIQVKHLTLNPDLVEEIADSITADKIVVVCISSEKQLIEALLKQVGWGSRIQGIVTLEDLDRWYKLCLEHEKYEMSKNILKDLQREFEAEFPSSSELAPFLKERGYDKITFPNEWKV
ncbi:MAG: HaeII family restriction endonuclease [Patescibacteria group bacterium]